MKRLAYIIRRAKMAALVLGLLFAAPFPDGWTGHGAWAQTTNTTLLNLMAAVKTSPNGQLSGQLAAQIRSYLASNPVAAASIASSLVNSSGAVPGQAGVNLTQQVVGILSAASTGNPSLSRSIATGIGASVAVLAANGFSGGATTALSAAALNPALQSGLGAGLAAGLKSLPGTMPNGTSPSTSLTQAVAANSPGLTAFVAGAAQSAGQTGTSLAQPQPTIINPNQVTPCTAGSCN